MSRNMHRTVSVVALVVLLFIGVTVCGVWIYKSLPFILSRAENRTTWYADRPGEIQGVVDALLNGRSYDAVYVLRQVKVRSEVLGISKKEYVALLNDIIDRVRLSDEDIQLPDELTRAQDGNVRYGLFSGTSPLPAEEAEAEREEFVREVAMLRVAGKEEYASFLEDVTLRSLVGPGRINEAYRTAFKEDVARLVESASMEGQTAGDTGGARSRERLER